MKNTTETINKINNFPFYYEMSSSDKKYTDGENKKRDIRNELSEMSTSELIEVKKGLTVSIEDVTRYFPVLEDLTETVENTVSPVKENFRSKVFTNAWTILKNGIVSTFSKALKLAWRRLKAVTALKTGIAYFTFNKADGTPRKAIGTLRTGNFNYTPKTNKPKASKPSIVKYFDIEAKQFRSFRIDRLVEIAA